MTSERNTTLQCVCGARIEGDANDILDAVESHLLRAHPAWTTDERIASNLQSPDRRVLELGSDEPAPQSPSRRSR
jgi:hypothetical protein